MRIIARAGWIASFALRVCHVQHLQLCVKTSSRKGLLQARVIHFFIMASLNKLAIRGIRSFDDKNIAVIEFFSPVTVIVGHNGSGKTVSVSADTASSS